MTGCLPSLQTSVEIVINLGFAIPYNHRRPPNPSFSMRYIRNHWNLVRCHHPFRLQSIRYDQSERRLVASNLFATQTVTGGLFGVAILAFASRVYIRVRIQKQFFIEDVLILFAVGCLVSVIYLAYTLMQTLYDAIWFDVNGFNSTFVWGLGHISNQVKKERIEISLSWLVVCLVKMAYLFFFRRLVSRLRGFNIWWWCVVAVVVSAALVSLMLPWLICLHLTSKQPLGKWHLSGSHTLLIIAPGQPACWLPIWAKWSVAIR